ncbi:MAG: FAD binding domain-containing protein [Spirochaetales bacterium]|nr:FAD binding domain-containing protein [Spirochaetales bacterium]
MVDSYRPMDLKEALSIRAQHGAMPLAGGTDLMVRYQSWSGTLPLFQTSIMFVGHLREMKFIKKEDSNLVIGGTATLTDVANHPDTPVVLKEAVLSIAAPGLRNNATLTGNICNASPAGDSLCALYALDAVIVIEKSGSTRQVPVMEFITGPGRTVLASDELVTSIIVPLKASSVNSFTKVGTRRANALSKLSFTGVADYKNGRIDSIALTFGAVGPTVVRSVELEKKLTGLSGSELKAKISSVVDDYSTIIVPIDDQRSSAVYRKKVALNLLEKYLKELSTHE